MNIVLMAFADEDKIRDYESGSIPAEVALHEQIANYYKLSFLNLAQAVQQRIASREFTWAADFKELHPSPFGKELYRSEERLVGKEVVIPCRSRWLAEN